MCTQSLSLTLCESMDCSWPGSSVHGMFQARTLMRVAFCPPGDLPGEGSNTDLLHLLHWQADSLPLDYLGNPANSEVFYPAKVLFASCTCFVVVMLFLFVCCLSIFFFSNNNPFPGYPIFNGKSFQKWGYLNKLYCLSLLFVFMFNQLLPTGESE